MTRILLTICFAIAALAGQAQKSTWLRLNYPRSGILGKVVKNYTNGELNFRPDGKDLDNLKIDTSKSADHLTEYNEQFKSFLTKYFTNSTYHLTQVSTKALTIRSLNFGSVKGMNRGEYYVYSGMSADSVAVLVTVYGGTSINYGKFIKDVAGLITGQAGSNIVGKVLSVTDSISSIKKDSITLKMVLVNPEVYYQVQVVQYKNTIDDFSTIFKPFKSGYEDLKSSSSDKKYPDFKLVYTPLQDSNMSKEIYPRSRNEDIKEAKIKLKSLKVNGELKLFVSYTEPNLESEWIDKELPFIIDNGKKYWVIDRFLIYHFVYKGITKFIYLTVRAESINESTILVHGKSGNTVTSIQYPEAKLKYFTP